MKNPFLVGDRIYLSPLSEEDVSQRYVDWLNDPVVCRNNSHATFPDDPVNALEYVRSVRNSRTTMAFAIRLKESDQHVGNVSLQRIDYINRSAELAIIVGETDAWNKGVGTEAYRLLLDHAFKVLNLNRVSSGQTVRNKGMVKVCEKVGMKQEGVLRQALYKEGEYLDVVLYALLRTDYESK